MGYICLKQFLFNNLFFFSKAERIDKIEPGLDGNLTHFMWAVCPMTL